jgi:hypothetical protein
MASVFGLAMLAAAVVTVTVLAVRLAQPGPAEADSERECSIHDIAGNWFFATQVGHLKVLHPETGETLVDGDITALGTMNIGLDGSLIGVFDVTVLETFFSEGVGYSGSVTVNANCTGTLTFVTTTGAERTDSIAVLNDNEMWGMSQDPLNLWTYEVRRIPGQSHR